MEKIWLVLYLLKEDISKVKKTFLHIVLINVKRPVDRSFIRTEIEVCSDVMFLCDKVNSLTSGDKEVQCRGVYWCCCFNIRKFDSGFFSGQSNL